MSIQMLGIDHNRAVIDERALFSFTKKNAVAGMEQLKRLEGIQGCLILSTCNRMEIWISANDWSGSLIEELCKIKGVDPTEFQDLFVLREGKEAVDHLFHLACGLKSQILGEDQIISQVKDALSLARENYMADNVLEVLFRMAITSAKRVKTDVIFSRANGNAMDAAVAMLRKQGLDLAGVPAIVIGNGEMGKLAAQTLQKAGAEVTVTVRQYRSGMVTIPRGCARIHYGERYGLIPSCRLLISATASPNYTVTLEEMKDLAFTEPLILIDLAVPRDIEASVGEIPGITLYDIDDFKSASDSEYLKDSFEEAEAILQGQEEEFFAWYNGRDLVARIQEVKGEAVSDLEVRLHKTIRKLPIEEKEKAALTETIEKAMGKVMVKMLFGLKDSMGQKEFLDLMGGLEKLYEE